MDCLFCQMVAGIVPVDSVYEDEFTLAFHDKDPKAPAHVLVIPKAHVPTFQDLNTQEPALCSALFQAIQKVAHKIDPGSAGFRVVNNCGKQAFQSIYHVHFHVLAGRELGWPPG